MLLKHGGKDKYNVDHIGYNARLDTLQAAILLAKMKYVEEFNMRRRIIAKRYTTAFKATKGVAPPLALPDAYHVYHQYTIRISEGNRDKMQQRLKEADIATAIYYPVSLHNMKVFKEYGKKAGSLEIAEKMVNEVLSLPIEPLMTTETVKKIIAAIRG
jgi:UDP-2-acetamido-2-deoxy-ribo-hexuluronate aminotransferase